MKLNLFIKNILCSIAFILTISVFSLNSSALQLDFSVENSYVEHETKVDQSNEISEASLMSEEFEGVRFENGLGTEESPYIISTAQELLSIPYYVNGGINYEKYRNAYYKLANDIDLNGVEWTPIGTSSYPFYGSFNGNGKTISNFKISEANIYSGFFGFMRNASVLDLTVSDVKIEFSYTTHDNEAIYVGVIVGRAEAANEETNIAIQNCHVSNTEINVESNYRIYGSGHIGYLHCSNSAKVVFSGCTTDAVCNFKINDQSGFTITNGNDPNRSILRIGGILGYNAITRNGEVYISDCSSNAKIISNFTNLALQKLNDVHIGGFAGEFAISSIESESRSLLKLDQCYSTNMVYANADGGVYAGGFIGYLVSTTADVSISNCHTNSNIYALSSMSHKEAYYLAGFTSISGAQYTGKINIENCYATGNVIAIRQKNSRGCRFVSLVVGSTDTTFKNCYVINDTVVAAEHRATHCFKNTDDGDGVEKENFPEKVLNSDAATDLTEYTGFDINVWEPGEAPYKYPVLIDNKLVHGNYSAYYYLDNDLVKYKNELNYGDYPDIPKIIPDSHYIFSHWSTYPGNPDTLDETYSITSDVILFPNDSTEPKSYTITFMSRGKVFDVKSLKYDTVIEVPEENPDAYESVDKMFKYAFSHWSTNENGNAISDNYKISGEKTLYAVFKKLDLNVWDGISTMPISQGAGTVDNPYQISNAYHLAYLAKAVNSGEIASNSHYVIIEDIDLGNHEWTPIGTAENPFTGVLDGNGYSVHNFKITDSNTKYAGLFGYAKNSDISNLDVSEFTINIEKSDEYSYYAGGIAAFICSEGTGATMSIEQCRTAGNINLKVHIANVGGLVGSASDLLDSNVYIKNSYSECYIILDTADNSIAGGIISNITENSSIEKVYYTGNISAKSATTAIAGGIVGQALFAENNSDSTPIKNSFYVGEKIELVSEQSSSFAGAIYGYLKHANDDSFTVENLEFINCSYIDSAVISGANISLNETITKLTDITELYSAETLANIYGFDCENIWSSSENALPQLKAICRLKDKFLINKYDIISGTLVTELTMCFVDIDKCLILIGVYNARGKMIGFDSIPVNNPSELQEITISIPKVPTAVTATLSIINPANLHFIRPPQLRIFTQD